MDRENRPQESEQSTAALLPLDYKREMFRLGIPVLAVVFMLLFSAFLQGLLHSLVLVLSPALAEEIWYPWVMSSLPMYAVAMPLSLLLYRLVPAKTPARRKLEPHHFLFLLTVCFALTFGGNILGTVVNLIIGVITGEPQGNDFADAVSGMPLWVTLLFVGILAPIFEEIFYRKLILDRIAHFGELPAVLISGLLFGLIHGNFSQFFYAAAVGMLFGYIYLKTGKLKYTIALHMILNLVGGVFTNEMLGRLDLDAVSTGSLGAIAKNFGPLAMYYSYLFFMVVTFLVGVVAAICLLRKMSFARAKRPLRAKEWAVVLFANPATYAFLLVVVLLFLS